MIKKVLLLSLLSLAFCAQAVSAQELESSCGLSAWVIDKDPKGLNVRDKPNINGKVIAKLPHKSNEDDDIVIVYVVGYTNGWVKIASAEPVSGEKMFDDIGWISAKMVETGIQAQGGMKPATLYAQAKSTSRKLGTILSETTVKISGFSCGWLKVSNKGKTGWVKTSDICGSPVTTCN